MIGNRILELRKLKNLSQEQLAEKMDVTRQTISKWELGETAPDLEQSKKLSKIFEISLDDLTNNEIKNVILEKVNNTEKLTKNIINILKIIFLSIMIIIVILLFTVFCRDYFDVQPVETMQSIECSINDKKYSYEVWQTNETSSILDEIITQDDKLKVDVSQYTNYEDVFKAIKSDVESRGGNCY